MTQVYFFETKISGTKSEVKNAVSALAKEKLIEIAFKRLKTHPENIKTDRTKNGKPYFSSHPDFHFNISHSQNAFVVAISDLPVGIDIEEIRTPDLAVAKRFFNEQEVDYVNRSPVPRFFEIWTKKEAFIKCFGLTLKDIKNVQTADIFTTEKNGFIISVCSDDKDIVFEDFI